MIKHRVVGRIKASAADMFLASVSAWWRCWASLGSGVARRWPPNIIPRANSLRTRICPLSTSGVEDCVLAETKGGAFDVGKQDRADTHTVTLQGGFKENNRRGTRIHRRGRWEHAV